MESPAEPAQPGRGPSATGYRIIQLRGFQFASHIKDRLQELEETALSVARGLEPGGMDCQEPSCPICLPGPELDELTDNGEPDVRNVRTSESPQTHH